MIRTLSKVTVGAVVCAGMAGGLATLPAGAGARSCAPPATSPVPTLTAPCNGATITKGGKPPTFYASGKGLHGAVFIELTAHALSAHHGSGYVASPGVSGFYGQMRAVKGHPGRYMYRPTNYQFPGSWIEKGGTYHVQLGAPRPGTSSFGPVSTIHVR